MPALIAAAYSFISILLTIFMFKETLLPAQRRSSLALWHWRTWLPDVTLLKRPQMGLLMLLMFAQQVVFYGFESLLGLFTLNRLGLLGQGNSLIFIFVGIVLVYGQTRLIGKWKKKYGEQRLSQIALGLLAVGLLLLALTPAQPHPFYIKVAAEREVQTLAPSSTEAMIGQFAVQLPDDANRGVGGYLWLLGALVPLSIGAGLIRPSLNALITQRASRTEYGAVLGLSAALVTLANAVAPVIGGLIYQQYGMTAPFLVGAVVITVILLFSIGIFRRTMLAQAS
jgi:MFS family permease